MSALFPLIVRGAQSSRRGARLVGPVDLELTGDGTTVVVGPNGSGKTSLLAMLHGTNRLSGGEIQWAVPLEQAQSRQAFVFQRPVMLRRTVIDDIAYPLLVGSVGRADAHRAMIAQPELLFLDEPCAALDGRATREIEAILAEVRQDGTSIILSTHDLGQARRLADNVVFMLRGQVHERGAAKTFFDAPKTPEAMAFLRGDIVE